MIHLLNFTNRLIVEEEKSEKRVLGISPKTNKSCTKDYLRCDIYYMENDLLMILILISHNGEDLFISNISAFDGLHAYINATISILVKCQHGNWQLQN